MNKQVIKPGMNLKEIVIVMANGNPGALNILLNMLKDDRGLSKVFDLDYLGIRGSKLYMLFSDSCQKDEGKFYRTIDMLSEGVFTEEQIMANLEQIRSISFIDESIKINGVPPYEVDFGPQDEKWSEYCLAHQKSFSIKISQIIEQQDQTKNK
jgi:hypothetical protein